MSVVSMTEILKLTPKLRLKLVGEIWDSLEPSAVPVPASHVRELTKRLTDHDSNLDSTLSWPSVKEQVEKKLGRYR